MKYLIQPKALFLIHQFIGSLSEETFAKPEHLSAATTPKATADQFQ
jgi:hypothetical protein